MTGLIIAAYLVTGVLLAPVSGLLLGDRNFGPASVLYIAAWPVFALGWLLLLPYLLYGKATRP